MEGDGRTSRAWQFFTDLNDYKAKCNYCGKIMSYRGSGPSSLIRHTKSQHKIVYYAIREDNEGNVTDCPTSTNFAKTSHTNSNETVNPLPVCAVSPSFVVISASSTGTTEASQPIQNVKETIPRNDEMTENFSEPLSERKIQKLNTLLVTLFSKQYLPFHLVETQEMKDFIQELNPTYELPSRKMLSNALLINAFNLTKEKVEIQLEKAKYFSLTTDGWTSKPDDSYLAVTVHFLNENTELKSYMLDCFRYGERHTAENLAGEFKRVAADWKIQNKIVCVTSDNASNVKAAIELTGWENIPCFAHTLNLIVQSAVKEIKDTQTKVEEIVELFKRSPLAAGRLRSMQEKLGEPGLKLKNDDPTRWNSTCEMFERVLKVKKSLQSTIALHYQEKETITNEDIEILEKAAEILSFFKDVAEEMSSEKEVTISEVIVMSNALRENCAEFLKKESLPITVQKMAKKLNDELFEKFQKVEEQHLFAQSTILDPRFKNHGFQNQDVYQSACLALKELAGKIFLQKTDVVNNKDDASESRPQKRKHRIFQAFDGKVRSIIKERCENEAGIREVEKYLEEPLLTSDKDPLKWWSEEKKNFPRLYDISCQRFCIPCTSVPPERIFSKAGQLLDERRNRLSGNQVSKILFLNKNLEK